MQEDGRAGSLFSCSVEYISLNKFDRNKVEAIQKKNGNERRFDDVSSSGFVPNKLSGMGGQGQGDHGCIWDMGDG